jgi:hypothetical protein
MTLPVTTRSAGPFSCNGALVAFDFAFKVFAEADIRVVLTDSGGVEADITAYSVVLNSDQQNDPGGTVTTTTAYALGYYITIDGALGYEQPTELTNLGGFFPKVVERALDRLGILIQQLKKLTDRSLKLPVSLSGYSTEIVNLDAAKFLRVNAAGTGFEGADAVYDLGNFTQSGPAAITRLGTAKLGEHISAKDWASLNAAITAAGSTETTILLPSSSASWPITLDLAVPSNIGLDFDRGAIFNISRNKTVTFGSAANIDAGPYKIFNFDPTYTFDGATQPGAPGTFRMPVTLAKGSECPPEWFGAVRDGVTSDRTAMWAAIDSLWQRGKLSLLTGDYFLSGTGRTDNLGTVSAIWWTNDYSAKGHTTGTTNRPKLVIEGAGDYNTIISANNSSGYANLAHFYANGEGMDIRDTSVNVTLDSGARATRCLQIQGNSVRAERIGTGGGSVGIRFFSTTSRAAVNGCWDEYSDTGLLIDESCGVTVDDYESFQAVTAGIKVKATAAGIGSLPLDQTLPPIVINRPLCENGYTGTSAAIVIDVEVGSRISVEVNGAIFGANNLDATIHGAYCVSIVKSYMASFNGGQFFHVPYGCLVGTGYNNFIGVHFYQMGMFDQSVPFASRVLDITAGAHNVISGCLFDANAGHAIYSKSTTLNVGGSRFTDCANGGLTALKARAAATNATVGNAVIYWQPQTVGSVFHLTHNHFYAPSAEKAGKIGVWIDCSIAVPDPASGGGVFIHGNTMDPSSFAVPFKVTGATAAQVAKWSIAEDQLTAHADSLMPAGPVIATPLPTGVWLAADVPNNRLFRETADGKLYSKDAVGTVNALY